MVLQHALDGQRDVVVAGALAVARAGDRVLAGVVGAALVVHAGRDDADRLAFEHRERHGAEVEHDVVRVVVAAGVLADLGDAHIADHRGGDGLLGGFRAVEVGVRVRGGPGRQRGAVLRAVECGLAIGRRGQRHRRGFDVGRSAIRHPRLGQLLGCQLGGQLVPLQLHLGGVGQHARHHAPVVDRAGRAWRDAVHAQVALAWIDHVVARIVRDRAHRTDRLAGVAADADLRVDEVLADDCRVGHVHGGSPDREEGPRGALSACAMPCTRPVSPAASGVWIS